MTSSQTITINVCNWHRGHRDHLTYSEFDGPNGSRQKIRVKTNHSLVGIARAITKALRVRGDNVTLQLRTVAGGHVKIEGFAENGCQVGRPAYAVVWYLVSPLPRRLQIDKFYDYNSGLPETLENRSFKSLSHFENEVGQAGMPEGARWTQRRPRTTDNDRRLKLGHKLMMLSLRKRKPPTVGALRKALEVARAGCC